jgi:AcrR family transcriptional regulator
MASIASAAGVARATLYRYFPTRTVLLEQLRESVVARVGEELEAARLEKGPSRRAIERSARALLAAGDAFAVVAANELLSRSDGFERRVAEPVRRAFERGQERGDVRDDVSPRFLAEALIGLAAAVYRLSDAVGREDLVAGVADVFIDGVRGKHRRASASR